MEYAMFPIDYLSISQGRYNDYNPYSHSGQNAIDFIGASKGERRNVFAPYTCTVKFKDSYWGLVIVESIDIVQAPNGAQSKQWMALMHDNDVSDVYIGKSIPQWQHFFNMGDTGNSSGVHVHIECGFGNAPTNWNQLSAFQHADIENCVYVPTSCTIANTAVYTFIIGDGGPSDADWQEALRQRVAAKTRKNDAQTKKNNAQTKVTNNRNQYNTNYALQQDAEGRVRNLEHLADNLISRTQAQIAQLREEIDYTFS